MLDIVTSTATIAAHPVIASTIHDGLLAGATGALAGLALGAGWLMRIVGSKLRFDWERGIARRLVAWAETKFEGSAEKRAQVAAALHAKFPILSTDEIDHLIEEAVSDLNSATQQIAVVQAPVATPASVGGK